MEVITPVSAVEHNTLFPRYDDGQQPEWYESELYLSGQCNWVNDNAYGTDGVDGFGCTDDEYFASRASEARWLEGLNEDAYGTDGAYGVDGVDPSTPAPAPAQNECSCCPDSLIGLHPDVDVYGDFGGDSEIVSPEEYALVQSHRAASEDTAVCYEGCMCDKDCTSYGPGPWFHSTVSLDEYALIQAYRLQQTQEPQQQSGCNEEEEELVYNEDEDLYQPHWGSMGDRLGGDDLSGVNLATPSWVNQTPYFPYINEDNKDVMWSSSSKCTTTFATTPGGAGVIDCDDADCGADMTSTSPLLTSPNSNPLGVHIIPDRLTDYLDDDYDLTVYSDGEGGEYSEGGEDSDDYSYAAAVRAGRQEGYSDGYSYAAAARAGRQEYSDDDNYCDNEGGYTGENESDWF